LTYLQNASKGIVRQHSLVFGRNVAGGQDFVSWGVETSLSPQAGQKPAKQLPQRKQ
jgi:hypothetical protein